MISYQSIKLIIVNWIELNVDFNCIGIWAIFNVLNRDSEFSFVQNCYNLIRMVSWNNYAVAQSSISIKSITIPIRRTTHSNYLLAESNNTNARTILRLQSLIIYLIYEFAVQFTFTALIIIYDNFTRKFVDRALQTAINWWINSSITINPFRPFVIAEIIAKITCWPQFHSSPSLNNCLTN